MTKPFENHGEKWWRFSKIEYRDGFLRPAEGARLEFYDPWALHRRLLNAGPADHPLDRLLALCSASQGPLPHLPDVIEWSQMFGPLGVLLYRTVYAVMPPKRDASGELVIEDFRFVGGWLGAHATRPGGATEREWLEANRPRALLRGHYSLQRALPDAAPIEETWGPYFPDVAQRDRASYAYPHPTQESFAAQYCEPLDEWATWAMRLWECVRGLNANATRDDRTACAMMLSSIASPICSVLDTTRPDAPVLRSRSPALLCSLALIAMQRVAGGALARACKDPECGAVFLASNTRAEYHDNRCRWRHHKALQRADEAQAKAQAKASRKKRGKRNA